MPAILKSVLTIFVQSEIKMFFTTIFNNFVKKFLSCLTFYYVIKFRIVIHARTFRNLSMIIGTSDNEEYYNKTHHKEYSKYKCKTEKCIWC